MMNLVEINKANDSYNRFLKKVEIDDSGCWVWKGAKVSGGYGSLMIRGKYFSSHRYSYEVHKSPIPKGLHLDHLCRNRACCNPDHLEPVTQRENNLRGERFTPEAIAEFKQIGRESCLRNNQKRKEQTHCKRGHSLEDAHVYKHTRNNGGTYRMCRHCLKLRKGKLSS